MLLKNNKNNVLGYDPIQEDPSEYEQFTPNNTRRKSAAHSGSLPEESSSRIIEQRMRQPNGQPDLPFNASGTLRSKSKQKYNKDDNSPPESDDSRGDPDLSNKASSKRKTSNQPSHHYKRTSSNRPEQLRKELQAIKEYEY